MQFYNSIILLIGSEHLEKFCVFCFAFHIGFSTYSCHKAPAVEHGIALLTNHNGHWNIFSAADFPGTFFPVAYFPGTYFRGTYFPGAYFPGTHFLLQIFLVHIFLEHIFCCRFSWDIFSWNIFFLQHIFTAYFLLHIFFFLPKPAPEPELLSAEGSLCKNGHKISDTLVGAGHEFLWMATLEFLLSVEKFISFIIIQTWVGDGGGLKSQ